MGKIKNTEGSAMSVGLLVVRLKYGLYVGHLSKWFVFVFNVQFLVVCLWLHCRLLGLLITFCSLPKVAIFSTNFQRSTKVYISTKLSYEARNRHFWQGAVMRSCYYAALLFHLEHKQSWGFACCLICDYHSSVM